VGLTGSILVFQDEIDVALNKNLFESLKGQKRYSIDEVIPVVQQNILTGNLTMFFKPMKKIRMLPTAFIISPQRKSFSLILIRLNCAAKG